MSRLDKAPRGLPGLPAPQMAGTPVWAAPEPAQQRAEAAYAAAGVEAPRPAPEPVPEPVEQPERKQKIGGWNGYPSNLARIRAAWWHTQTQADGWPSLSEMTEQVLLAEAARLEAAHNGGQPFPEVPDGKVKHGRRLPGN